MLSDRILRALNLDEDEKASSGEVPDIFKGSFQLLMNQATYQSQEKKGKHPKKEENEGGESDAFHRLI